MVLPDYTTSSAGGESTDTGFKLRFICWYCRSKAEQKYRYMPVDIFESSCSAGSSDCDNVLRRMVGKNVFDFGAHFWYCVSCNTFNGIRPSVTYDPLARHIEIPGEVNDAVLHFLYGKNGTRLKYGRSYFPSFGGTRRNSKFFKESFKEYKGKFVLVGETPAIKFVTMDGVIDVKSSYDVYLGPFTPQVWWVILASACVSFLAEVLLVQAAYRGLGWPPYSEVHEAFYWKLASFVGHSTVAPTQEHQR